MTIDEAQMKIESIGAMFCGRCIRKDCANCNIHKAYQTMNDALEELEWYREQDLISRNDALVRTAQTVSSDDIYTKIFITLKQIPKAEYRGERDE